MEGIFVKSSAFSFEDMIGYSEGGVISKQVLKNDAGNVTLFSFDREQGLSEHAAPFDALVQILDGKAEIRLDGELFTLGKGESIIMPAGVRHSLHAAERFKMLLTMIRG